MEPKTRGRKKLSQKKVIIADNTPIQEDDCVIAHIPLNHKEISEMESLESSNLNSFLIVEDIYNEKPSKKIKDYESTIKALQDEITTLKRQLQVGDHRDTKIILHYTNPNNAELCWWCCHSFTTEKVSLPYSYHNNEFMTEGTFCSYNCAAAYNLNKKDLKIWERAALLHHLYKKSYNKDIVISPSPPKEILKAFGGQMTIEKFRNALMINNKEFITLHPPMASITTQIEERLRPGFSKVITGQISEDMKLKRVKPLPTSRYSLEETMGLKRTNK